MTPAIEVRRVPDGRLQARRKDNRPLTEEDRDTARRMAIANGLIGLDEGRIIIALLIESTVVGAEIWFALGDDWRPDEGDGVPIFYASELPALRQKTPEHLREMHKAKLAFPGSRIVREEAEK